MNFPMNPFQMMGNQMPQFNEKQFRELLPKIDDKALEQAKQMARQFGLSEQQIEDGMKIIQQMR